MEKEIYDVTEKTGVFIASEAKMEACQKEFGGAKKETMKHKYSYMIFCKKSKSLADVHGRNKKAIICEKGWELIIRGVAPKNICNQLRAGADVVHQSLEKIKQ